MAMPESDDDPTLDVKSTARFTGVAVATLAKMRCVGGSPVFIKAGRKVLYRRSDLIAWLNARRASNTAQAAVSLPRRITDPVKLRK
jgi:hypothetical protein